jgi:hypothetical protein
LHWSEFLTRVAVGALLFLVIDPTVAAHWPVVMTDLPVALLSATLTALGSVASIDGFSRTLAVVLVDNDFVVGFEHARHLSFDRRGRQSRCGPFARIRAE